ncbi:hypothetical protein K490DRAFT_60903 [Saccharata proteae CBS 121410]|uniref:C2H2-type domain-containing protein n=1 Tax=Saccharata proteae CBS 121410 TaxID=1314787 RepID=A0A9P4I1I7_9PEZI|nr:hypothetical protein K490DRAFT_60903 [Saccharata proteae CBS 121410]
MDGPYPDPDHLLYQHDPFTDDLFAHDLPSAIPSSGIETPISAAHFLNQPEWPTTSDSFSLGYEGYEDYEGYGEYDGAFGQLPQDTSRPMLELDMDGIAQFAGPSMCIQPEDVHVWTNDAYNPGDRIAPPAPQQNQQQQQQQRATSTKPHRQRRATPRRNGFPCENCEKVFNRKCDLKRHGKNHIKTTERRYKCKRCDKGFLYPKDLQRHLETHSDASRRSRLSCPVDGCTPKGFGRKDNLRRHMQRCHGSGSQDSS